MIWLRSEISSKIKISKRECSQNKSWHGFKNGCRCVLVGDPWWTRVRNFHCGICSINKLSVIWSLIVCCKGWIARNSWKTPSSGNIKLSINSVEGWLFFCLPLWKSILLLSQGIILVVLILWIGIVVEQIFHGVSGVQKLNSSCIKHVCTAVAESALTIRIARSASRAVLSRWARSKIHYRNRACKYVSPWTVSCFVLVALILSIVTRIPWEREEPSVICWVVIWSCGWTRCTWHAL